MISWKSVEIIAGIDGSLNYPSGICYSKIDRQLYVTDMHNHRVCKIDLEDSSTTALPNITTNNDNLKRPLAICCSNDNTLFVTDAKHNEVFWFNRETEKWVKSGLDDNDKKSTFTLPSGISIDENDNLYVVDFMDDIIYSIEKGGISNLIADNYSDIENADFNDSAIKKPYGIFCFQQKLYILDSDNRAIRYFDLKKNRLLTLIKGNTKEDLVNLVAITVNTEGEIFFGEQRRLFRMKSISSNPEVVLDREIWNRLKSEFNLPQRLTYIGALVAPENNSLILVDTLKGLIYNMKYEN